MTLEPQVGPPNILPPALTSPALATATPVGNDSGDTPPPIGTEVVHGNSADVSISELQDTATAAALTPAPTLADASRLPDTLGNAQVYPFYDEKLTFPDSVLVELQLIMAELAVTPTPFGQVTLVPANEGVQRPSVASSDVQVTPRPAKVEERIEGLPYFVIAELQCNREILSGCDEKPVRGIQLVGFNKWTWRINPLVNAGSTQSLSLLLYAARPDGEKLSNTPLWQHDFQMVIQFNPAAVNSPSAAKQNLTPILMAIAVTVVLLVGVVLYALRWRNRPKVFISYRRQTSAGDARLIHDGLKKKGANVFIDIDDIGAGSFSEYIRSSIMKSDYFIVVLSPKTLESEWVMKEVRYAHEHQKTIIPVLVNGFNLYGEEVTPDLAFLQIQNAVTLTPEFWDASIARLASLIFERKKG